MRLMPEWMRTLRLEVAARSAEERSQVGTATEDLQVLAPPHRAVQLVLDIIEPAATEYTYEAMRHTVRRTYLPLVRCQLSRANS